MAFGLVIQQNGGALLISWISSELTEWKILFLKKLECIFLEMMDDHIELVFDEIYRLAQPVSLLDFTSACI